MPAHGCRVLLRRRDQGVRTALLLQARQVLLPAPRHHGSLVRLPPCPAVTRRHDTADASPAVPCDQVGTQLPDARIRRGSRIEAEQAKSGPQRAPSLQAPAAAALPPPPPPSAFAPALQRRPFNYTKAKDFLPLRNQIKKEEGRIPAARRMRASCISIRSRSLIRAISSFSRYSSSILHCTTDDQKPCPLECAFLQSCRTCARSFCESSRSPRGDAELFLPDTCKSQSGCRRSVYRTSKPEQLASRRQPCSSALLLEYVFPAVAPVHRTLPFLPALLLPLPVPKLPAKNLVKAEDSLYHSIKAAMFLLEKYVVFVHETKSQSLYEYLLSFICAPLASNTNKGYQCVVLLSLYFLQSGPRCFDFSDAFVAPCLYKR